ncbi:MAG TPA: serine/threonine-protein kinase, partial [Polyangiaceae bacterium]|nr:serine/threonine-protein kinase [Polyangiaceae bacterium]
ADLLARERRLPALAAVSTLLPIAHGLATAHEGGIIHRDVKPENIFLATTDLGTQPKLLDFGIARFTDRMQRLTLEGVVLGTPDYLSPEQARGEKVTPAADLWSFCVVLYELVTGRCPFQGEGYYELLRSIVEQAPAPLAAHGVSEPELWRILARGLSKRPSDRYPTLRELGQALAEWAIARGLQEDVTGTSLRRTWLRDAEGSVPDRSPVGAEPGSVPRPGAGSEVVAASSRGMPSGRGARSGPDGSFTVDEVPTDAELAALAAVSELGDPDDLFYRSNRWRLVAVIAALVGLVALGVVLLLASAGLFELGVSP